MEVEQPKAAEDPIAAMESPLTMNKRQAKALSKTQKSGQ
jgi:hypothetical protein